MRVACGLNLFFKWYVGFAKTKCDSSAYFFFLKEKTKKKLTKNCCHEEQYNQDIKHSGKQKIFKESDSYIVVKITINDRDSAVNKSRILRVILK